MDRLFLSFQLKLLLSLLAAGLLFFLIIRPRIERQVTHNIEESLSAPLAVMAETISDELAKHPGQSQILERSKQRFGAPLALVSRAQLQLDAADLARFDRGEVVSAQDHHRDAILYARVGSTDQAIELGPLNPNHPLGEGRGLGSLALALGGLWLGVYLLVLPLRRRLSRLARAAEAFGRGELAARAPADSKDAIGQLARSFNGMAHDIQQLIATQRELLRMVSHELRTPLQRIHFAVEKVRDAEDPERRQDGLLRVERDLRELNSLIEELLVYVRLQHEMPLKRESVDLHQLVDDVIDAQSELRTTASQPQLKTSAPPPAELPLLTVDPRLVRRAITNLIGNALRHARSCVQVAIARRGQRVELDVEDDGPGIPPSDRQRIFEPFVRLSDESADGRGGHGLGLAIVRRIADRHHGTIEVESSSLGGARFRLSLPMLGVE